MSYNALRKGRNSIAGQVYFVTTVAHARRPYFVDFCKARAVVKEMRRLHDESAVGSLAWVVMPDHLHWLFTLNEQHTLGVVMKTLKGRSASACRDFGLTSSLWQANYFDHALRDEEDLAEIARYIVANPLRKGLVARLGDYPHWDAVWV